MGGSQSASQQKGKSSSSRNELNHSARSHAIPPDDSQNPDSAHFYPYVYDKTLIDMIKVRFTKRLAKAAKSSDGASSTDTYSNHNSSVQSISTSANKNSKNSARSDSAEHSAAAGTSVASASDVSARDDEWRKLVVHNLAKLDDWDFNVHELSNLCGNRPLIYVAYAALCKYDLFKRLSIDEHKVIQFLKKVQDMCRNDSVPFHNATHAADVLQGLNCFIRRGLNEYLSDEDIYATILAATILNAENPGLDNNYQELVESHMSTLFNGVATLQYHACSCVFFMIQQNEDCNIFSGLTPEQTTDIRESILCMVLETDSDSCLNAEDITSQTQQSSPIPGDAIYKELQGKMEKSCEFSDKNDVRLLMRVAIKLAYWSFCCMRPSSVFVESLKRLWTETFTQSEIEHEISPKHSTLYGRTFKRPTNDDEFVALGKSFSYFLGKKLKPLLHAFVDGLLYRLRSSKSHLLSNRKWMDEKFATCSELRKIPCDDQLRVQLKKNQQEIDSELRNRPIPEQARVIPLEEQSKRRRIQNEEQEQLETECREKLEQRFQGNEWRNGPLSGEAKIYALADYDSIAEPLTNEETRLSVMKMFDRIDHWNFDVFALTKLLGGESLFLTSYVLFTKYDLLSKFKIEQDILVNFLKRVQLGYQMNPYHNAMHACDVMQVTNSIMVRGGMMENLDNIDIMAALISSMVHDYDHPGLNNAFQTHSHSYLATLYNDRSVLENHHCAQTFRIMREEHNCDIFNNMSAEQRRDARQTMVGMIISTDMTNHGKYIAAFNSRIESESDFKNKNDIRLALQIAIKMADVSNPTRPLYLYLQWTDNIITEFFMQGDKEADHGLPVSPLMNRHTSVLSKGQIAFLQYIIIPMFNSFIQVFPKMEFTRKHIKQNQEHWETHTEIKKEEFAPGQWKDMHLAD